MAATQLKTEEMPQIYDSVGITTHNLKIIDANNQQAALKFAIQKKFRDFGLTKLESRIYMFLSKNGPKKAREISSEESIPRTEIYHLLSNLKNKGIVAPSIQRPRRFSAINIDKAMESIIENQQKKIEELKLLKDDMVYIWNSFQKMRSKRKSEFMKFKSTNLLG